MVSARPWPAACYEVRPFDPIAFGEAGAGPMPVLTLAVYRPARRAARIDLLLTLGDE